MSGLQLMAGLLITWTCTVFCHRLQDIMVQNPTLDRRTTLDNSDKPATIGTQPSQPFPPPPWSRKPGNNTKNVLDCCTKFAVAAECLSLCHPHEVSYWFDGAVVCRYTYWHIVHGCWRDGVPLKRSDVPTHDPPYMSPKQPQAVAGKLDSLPSRSGPPNRCNHGATFLACSIIALASLMGCV